MARNRSAKGRDKGTGLCVGNNVSFQPVPLDFLRSRECFELSPHAAKLLIDILGLMGPNGRGNGDISLSFSLMKRHGWSSAATLNSAITEMIENSLLVITRRGGRRAPNLYAFGLYALDCDLQKLDVTPDYVAMARRSIAQEKKKPPTHEHPAKWRNARKVRSLASKFGLPRGGSV